MIEFAILLIFPAAMAMAAAMDIFTMTIPNRIPLALLAGFAVVAAFAGLGLQDVMMHLSAGVVMLAVGILLFALGWVGGGDAKLFAATALWLGWAALPAYVVYVALMGGVLALVLIALRQIPLPDGLARQGWIARLHNAAEGAPYGVALAGAGLTVYPSTVWLSLAA